MTHTRETARPMTVGERMAEIRAMDDDEREERQHDLDFLERVAQCGYTHNDLIPDSQLEWYIHDVLMGGRRSHPPQYDYEAAARDYRADFFRISIGGERYWIQKGLTMTDEQIAHRRRVDQAVQALVELGYRHRESGALLPPEDSATDEVTLGEGTDAIRIRPVDMSAAQLKACAAQEVDAREDMSPETRYRWPFPASRWTQKRHDLLRDRVVVQNFAQSIYSSDTGEDGSIWKIPSERAEQLGPEELGYHVYDLPAALGEAFFNEDISDYDYIVVHGRHVASYRFVPPRTAAPFPADDGVQSLDVQPWF